MGNKTLLTRELADKIADCLRAGNYIETAAAYGGIARRTLYDWLKRGTPGNEAGDPSGIYRYFAALTGLARAEAQVHAVAELRKGEGQWQRWAWWLERSFPKLWGRVEYRGNAEDAEAGRDDEVLAKLLEKLDTAEKNLRRKQAEKNE